MEARALVTERRSSGQRSGWMLRPWRDRMTIVAFTESGRIHRLRLPVRLLVVSAFLLLILVAGATASILLQFRGQVDVARMSYLERENRSLTDLLQGQAEQLSRLKLEVARLRELEQNLRVVSGIDSPAETAGTMIGTGQARGPRQALPRKR